MNHCNSCRISCQHGGSLKGCRAYRSRGSKSKIADIAPEFITVSIDNARVEYTRHGINVKPRSDYDELVWNFDKMTRMVSIRGEQYKPNPYEGLMNINKKKMLERKALRGV